MSLRAGLAALLSLCSCGALVVKAGVIQVAVGLLALEVMAPMYQPYCLWPLENHCKLLWGIMLLGILMAAEVPQEIMFIMEMVVGAQP